MTNISELQNNLTMQIHAVKQANSKLKANTEATEARLEANIEATEATLEANKKLIAIKKEIRLLNEANKRINNTWRRDVDSFISTLINLQEQTGFDDDKLMHKLAKSCEEHKRVNEVNYKNTFEKEDGSIDAKEIAGYLIPSASKTNRLEGVVNTILTRGREIPRIIKGKSGINTFQGGGTDRLNKELSKEVDKVLADQGLEEEYKNLSDDGNKPQKSSPQYFSEEDLKLLGELEKELEKESSPSTTTINIDAKAMNKNLQHR